MKLDELDKQITPSDLEALETFADRIFGKVGIDVEFTRHFLDRVNDERNGKQITASELTRLFKQEYKRWGQPIAQMGPDQEAVMKDLVTDINMPFALRWDKENEELDLIVKTVMRKPDFKTSNKEFPVESSGIEREKKNEGRGLYSMSGKTGLRHTPTIRSRTSSASFLPKATKKPSLIKRIFSDEFSEKEEKKDDLLKGFDPRTERALMMLKAKYPQADNILSALLADVENNEKDSDVADLSQELKMEKLSKAVDILQKEINILKKDKKFNAVKESILKEETTECTACGGTGWDRSVTPDEDDRGCDECGGTGEINESIIKEESQIWKFNKEDPNNPEVLIQGFGRLMLNQIEDSVVGKLEDLVKRAESKDWQNIDALLDRDVMQTMIKAIINTKKDLEKTRKRGGPKSRGINKDINYESKERTSILDVIGESKIEEFEKDFSKLNEFTLSDVKDMIKKGWMARPTEKQWKNLVKIYNKHSNLGNITRKDLIDVGIATIGRKESVKETGGVGKVVPGINTSVDVGPNEIKKQAAKFGNDVDKDGVPKKNLR